VAPAFSSPAIHAEQIGGSGLKGEHVPQGPAQSDLERRIASVWRSVLRLRTIQLDDDFFDLGGTSLQMAQMHQQICQEMGRELRWSDVLRVRTIRAIAALVDGPGAHAAGTISWQGINYTYRYLKHRAAPESIPLVLITRGCMPCRGSSTYSARLETCSWRISWDPDPRTTCPVTMVSTSSPTA
jgi:acyl carrier protein